MGVHLSSLAWWVLAVIDFQKMLPLLSMERQTPSPEQSPNGGSASRRAMQQANCRTKRAGANAAQEGANQANIAKATKRRLDSQTSSVTSVASAMPLTIAAERKAAFLDMEGPSALSVTSL